MAGGHNSQIWYANGNLCWSLTPAAEWARRKWIADQAGVSVWAIRKIHHERPYPYPARRREIHLCCGYSTIDRYAVTNKAAKRLGKWIAPRTEPWNPIATGETYLVMRLGRFYFRVLPKELRTEEKLREWKEAEQNGCR